MTTFVYRWANNHSNSFSNIGKKAVKKKEQRERRRRLKERTEKKNKVDKMVGLLKVDEADMEKVLLNRDPMTKWEVIFTLIISFVFFFNFLNTIDIYGAFEIKESVMSTIMSKPFDSKGNTYINIISKQDLHLYLSNVMIPQVQYCHHITI